MNKNELTVVNNLKKQGYKVYTRGYPDCMVVDKSGNIGFIEIKHNGDTLSVHQKQVISVLKSAGFHVEIWKDPDKDKKFYIDSNINVDEVFENGRDGAISRLALLESNLLDANRILHALNILFLSKKSELMYYLGINSAKSLKEYFDDQKLFEGLERIYGEDAHALKIQLEAIITFSEIKFNKKTEKIAGLEK